MAITLELLEKDDVLEPTDWVRPSYAQQDNFGNSSIDSLSTYGGTPINHLRWVRAADVLGECWMGSTLGSLEKAFKCTGGFNYEVVRGPVPHDHTWDWRNIKD